MQSYKDGDTGAFECLYRRHKDRLFSYLCRNSPSSAIAEELAQETWMAIINRASGYESKARFQAWLYQIAHHRMVDFWRRKDNQNEYFDHVTEPTHNGFDLLPDQLDLWHAVTQLPDEQKQALLLQHEGFSQKEIAEITGAVEETVKSRLRYGRAQLREQLAGAL